MIVPKPLVYVAGPYTSPDPVENTHLTIHDANALVDAGCSVIVPHLTLLWHMVTPRPYEQWLDIDLQHVIRCDALYRREGASSGADGEVKEALEHGLPVFHTLEQTIFWAQKIWSAPAPFHRAQ